MCKCKATTEAHHPQMIWILGHVSDYGHNNHQLFILIIINLVLLNSNQSTSIIHFDHLFLYSFSIAYTLAQYVLHTS